MKRLSLFFVLVILLFGTACSKKKSGPEADASAIKFTMLPATITGITFSNIITESDSVNLIANAYTYMGSGVGIGDFDNDGLMDVFFGASQQSSRLYRNRGNLKFEDITQEAGLQTAAWVTGVSVADVNSDGFADIYLCVSGNTGAANRKNLLFINNQNLTFTERAAEYGLADTAYSTQALFLDYDRDGDLDLYLLNHLLDHQQSNNIVPREVPDIRPAGDKLYRNNGSHAAKPHFEDVSASAGILENGYGLGVVSSDFNNDGWPDLYVANDYLANDLLWLNNRNGTFTNTIGRSVRHQSYSSMGVDAADINNDGLSDIVTLDMQPEDNKRKKEMYSFLSYDRYVMERRAGYEEEYMRNMLQLNNGLRTIRDTSLPFFSEVGQLAGISETDWSWSALFTDLDNDGFRDLHITNGLGRDMLNSDFISFAMAAYSSRAASRAELNKRVVQKLDEYGMAELRNYCYRNGGNLQFTDVTKDAGLDQPSISSGCAYADLDNDGDLDLITNNINREAFVCRNDLRTPGDTTHNYLMVVLKGEGANTAGYGARLEVYAGGMQQTAEQAPVRGYLSTVDSRLHFGLGGVKTVDSLKITWPDGRQQRLLGIAANKTVVLQQSAANPANLPPPTSIQPLFVNISNDWNVGFKHSETFFYDYGPQQTLPQKYSQLGPFLAQGDVNSDGLEDFFVGGAAGQPGQLLIQQHSGGFVAAGFADSAKIQEDLGCLLFDADGDRDLDLFINSGSNEFRQGSQAYLPRLYRNDGTGRFTPDPAALPSSLFTSAQCVAGADYDGDGDTDLFIGGRIWPGQYPVAPASYILQNNGGNFTDVTATVCSGLQNPGMVTAAVWADVNGDKKPDLMVAGEWMPIGLFINKGQTLELVANSGLGNSAGQWRSLAATDLDGDGDTDFAAGNLGLNHRFRISSDQPMKLYAKDLDGNGTIDPVVAYYLKDEKGNYDLYPAIGRDQFALQVPLVKKSFLLHADYARANLLQVMAPFGEEDMTISSCNETRSVWLENKGNGSFTIHPLPVQAQLAPVNAIVCADVEGDGAIDIILAGNEYQAEVSTGRYDASYGLLLRGNGRRSFVAVPPATSGLVLDGDVKDMKLVTTADKKRMLVVAANDAPLQAFLLR